MITDYSYYVSGFRTSLTLLMSDFISVKGQDIANEIKRSAHELWLATRDDARDIIV
jgi:hypothetical protein